MNIQTPFECKKTAEFYACFIEESHGSIRLVQLGSHDVLFACRTWPVMILHCNRYFGKIERAENGDTQQWLP